MCRVKKKISSDNVLTSANAAIFPSVVLGDRRVVGDGAVVTRSFFTGSVVAGKLAKRNCGVDRLFDKCNSGDVLVSAPESFEKSSDGFKVGAADIEEFRSVCREERRTAPR